VSASAPHHSGEAPRRVSSGGTRVAASMSNITVTFIGNATTLISSGDLTVPTDPNVLHQGQHAYLGYGLVSRWLREPALSIEELPPIDLIALSHLHADHWNRIATKHLDRRLPPVITTTHG
jgi:L-ascorbate metabolism protein UlaG (beta-lactamase superfamily)